MQHLIYFVNRNCTALWVNNAGIAVAITKGVVHLIYIETVLATAI